MATAGEIVYGRRMTYMRGRLPGDVYVVVATIPAETWLMRAEDKVVKLCFDVLCRASQYAVSPNWFGNIALQTGMGAARSAYAWVASSAKRQSRQKSGELEVIADTAEVRQTQAQQCLFSRR